MSAWLFLLVVNFEEKDLSNINNTGITIRCMEFAKIIFSTKHEQKFIDRNFRGEFYEK